MSVNCSGRLPDYIVVGHVTRDLVPGDGYVSGGTACYSAVYADMLGRCVGVVTRASALPDALVGHPNISVACQLGEVTTTYENVYVDGARTQYIRAVALPILNTDVPKEWLNASIVHLGPLNHELSSDIVDLFPHSLIGVTPQGWLRAWEDDGRIVPCEWHQAETVLDRADAVILSQEDVGGDWTLLRAISRKTRLLVVTDGRHGAVVYNAGEVTNIPAYEVAEVDPTGAGDVFAAAFLSSLQEHGDPIEAARFGNCVASFVVENVGAYELPSPDIVRERLERGRVRQSDRRFWG